MSSRKRGSTIPLELISKMDQVIGDIGNELNSPMELQPPAQLYRSHSQSLRDSAKSSESKRLSRNSSIKEHRLSRIQQLKRTSAIPAEAQSTASDSEVELEFGVPSKKALERLGVSEHEILERNKRDSARYSGIAFNFSEEDGTVIFESENPARVSIGQDDLDKFNQSLPNISPSANFKGSRHSVMSLMSTGSQPQPQGQQYLSPRRSFDSLRSSGSIKPLISSPLADLRYASSTANEGDDDDFPTSSSGDGDEQNVVNKRGSIMRRWPQNQVSSTAREIFGLQEQPSSRKSGRSSIFITGKNVINRVSAFLGTNKGSKVSLAEMETVFNKTYKSSKTGSANTKVESKRHSRLPIFTGEDRPILLDVQERMISSGYLFHSLELPTDSIKTYFILTKNRLYQFSTSENYEPLLDEIPINERTRFEVVDSELFLFQLSYTNDSGDMKTWYLACDDDEEFQRWRNDIHIGFQIEHFANLSLPDPPIPPKPGVDSYSLFSLMTMLASNSPQESTMDAPYPVQSAIAILEAI